MKLYRIIKTLAEIAAFVGIILIFGSIGSLDYFTQTGAAYSFSLALKNCLLGVALCVPITIIAFNERGDE